MIVRAYLPEDEGHLRAIHAQSGYGFPFPSMVNALTANVVVDDAGEIMMGCAAETVVEATLFCAGETHPLVKLKAISMLHHAMRDSIVGLGYKKAFAFLPPELVGNYGRHLTRKFGWQKCWQSYQLEDWKTL